MNASSLVSLPFPPMPPEVVVGRAGRCVNEVCDVGMSGRALVVDGDGRFLCPSCGGPLEALAAKKAPSLRGRGRAIMSTSFAAAAVLGIAVTALEMTGQGSFAPIAVRPARTALAPALPAPLPTISRASAPPARATQAVAAATAPQAQLADLPSALLIEQPFQTTPLQMPGPVQVAASAHPRTESPTPAAAMPTPQPASAQDYPASRSPKAAMVAPKPVIPAAPESKSVPDVLAERSAVASPARSASAFPRPDGEAPNGVTRPFSAVAIAGGQPAYPDGLSDAATAPGLVAVSCLITTDGTPRSCRESRLHGRPEFVRAVHAWLSGGAVRFAPILRNGVPVAEQHSWTIQFHTQDAN